MTRAARILPLVMAFTLTAACASSEDATPDESVADPTSPAATSAAPNTTATPSSTSPTSSTADPQPASTTSPTTSVVPDTSPATTEPGPEPEPEPAAFAYPSQPSDVPWPTEDWPVGELPADVDRAALDQIVDAEFGPADNEARLRSIMAVQGGEIVYERYHPLDPPDTILASFSVAKSVTSTLVGMLVDDGALDVDAPAPVPEWSDDERSAITLEQLLQMRSGLYWDEAGEVENTTIKMIQAPDFATYALEQPLDSEPGDVFEYSTGTTAILAEVVADHLGGPEALDAFIESELLQPLGIESTTLFEDSTGQFAGGLGFDSTLRDFARFGYLILRGGTWDSEQIVSQEWIDYARSPSPARADYGAQWWLDGPPGTFYASGLYGQHILIAPEIDAVFVATATNGGESWEPMIALYEALAAAGPDG